MDGRPLIIKIGGGAEMNLTGIVDDLVAIRLPTIIVHGANVLRDQIAAALGIERREVTSVTGYTSVLSDEPMLDAMMAAYAGIRNKRIVELCQQRGINAVGLCGLDGNVIAGRRNPGIRTRQGERKVLLRDLSGKPQSINVDLLGTLLANGYTPVLTPPIADESGTAINTENDDIVALVARMLNAARVVSFLEAPGLLRDADDPASVVPRLTPEQLETAESMVDGRMRRKIKALRTLVADGCPSGMQIVLADGRLTRPLMRALARHGTVIEAAVTPDSDNAPVVRGAATPADLQREFELDVYGKRGPTITTGNGATVSDIDGTSYLDCIAGHGALVLGHCHPAIVNAITRQAARLATCPGSFYNDVRASYLEALVRASPEGMQRAFLCNSGTEAVEAAMKFARVSTGRSEIIAMQGAFHGRTFGAMTLSGATQQSAPFAPLVPGVTHVPFNDTEQLEQAVSERTAAIILELVQGEGGVHVARPEFVRRARELCDRSGALLIVDEVQTGFGRTGRLFAASHYGVRADIICVAKGIANGFPMAAVLTAGTIAVPIGLHGSTFGGNPLACAAAAATLQVLQSGTLLASVTNKGNRLVEAIREENPRLVREIRHVGLMIGVEVRTRVKPLLTTLADLGVLALPAGPKVLRLLPPLVIDESEIDRVTKAVIQAANELTRG